MPNRDTWNDETRKALRERIRDDIIGNLRLAKHEPAEILETCREVYIEEDCPEDEWDAFMQFATQELDRAFGQLATEQSGWPAETDCDRLDRVETALRERGILLWQVSPCCDTCTGGELPNRIDAIDRRHPGFRERCRGHAFFIDQNMPDMLADSTEISIYLAYGWFASDGANVTSEQYEKKALAIAQEVCRCIRDEGLPVHWEGDLLQKIGVRLNWQRCTMLK